MVVLRNVGGSFMPFKSSYPPPKLGTVYQHKYHGTLYTMVVVQTESGVGYKVGDKVFSSPTAAAKSIIGKDQSINGRSFWHMNESE
jgi:hypothetical protein